MLTEELHTILIGNGITPYFIKDKLIGIWNEKGTRKYRLNKLGIDIENLDLKISRREERRRDLNRNRKR